MKRLNKKIKIYTKYLNTFLVGIGINLKKLINLFFFFKFVKDLIKFKHKKGKIDYVFPILGEHNTSSSNIIPHYFYQDLIVSQNIYKDNPVKHVDIGSRVDGFCTHVASFRKIEIIDIRNNKINNPNIKFHQIDITNLPSKYLNYTDSLSCLHTIEHLGLGRYGDQIDPIGYKVGLKKISLMLKSNGTLYLSFPISHKNFTFFNMERRFHPKDVLSWNNNLQLENFDYIDDQENIFINQDIHKDFSQLQNGCGIYKFKKN